MKKPFFARFLESQELEEVAGAGRGHSGKSRNDTLLTKKYPSDDDEYVTLKYPSDNEDTTTL